LHGEAAWALFAQNKASAAEGHLVSSVREDPRLARQAKLIDGLVAIRDGRLEVGAKDLLAAQQDARYAHSLLPLLGLARAYQGLGRYDFALDALSKIQAAYKDYGQLGDEERTFAGEFYPSADVVALEIMRCRLALNQLGAAGAIGKQLVSRPLGAAARILLVNHYIAVGQAELAK